MEPIRRQVSRRQFLQLSAVTTAGVMLVACAPSGAPPAAPVAEAPAAPAADVGAGAAAPGTYNEAPMLADLVKAGSLPPVDDRLPKTPGVIPVAESVGNYGGTMRRGFRGVSDRWGPTKMQDRGLTWYDEELGLRAHHAESWEVNDDATEWTFHLREGMKWSDGSAFTTANIQWWYDNIFLNPEMLPDTGQNNANWTTGSDRKKFELSVADDYTFTLKFANPNPLFGFKVVRPTPPIYAPGEYMKQFHMDLTDDKAGLEAKVKEAGFDNWYLYFEDRSKWFLNPGRPSLGPWIPKNELSNELFEMERNPYYFGVDEAGNQLPYVDHVRHRLFETPDVFNLWITNGEIDFQARHVTLSNFTVFKESEEAGGYEVLIGKAAGIETLWPNQTTKNPRLNEFFNKRDVRIAMSVAVDRAAINELAFDGLLTPMQYSPLSVSPQYYEKQATAHIEYDEAKANTLLDAAGYAEKNADGIRLWNDGSGEEIAFTIEAIDNAGSPTEDAALEVVKYLNKVGLKAAYKGFERALFEEHYKANEIEAAWWAGDRTVLPLVAPIIWIGTQPDRPWCPAWSYWRNEGEKNPVSQQPPADHWINTIWTTWDACSAEPDAAKRDALFYQILDIWAEELPAIGFLGESPALVIKKKDMKNYTEGQPMDDTTGDENLLNTETYFWENPAEHV